MPPRRWIWCGALICAAALVALVAGTVGRSRQRTITIFYSGDLGGRISSLDGGEGASLSDVAACVEPFRAAAVTRGDDVLLVDVGGTLNGLGPLNESLNGLAMATAMKPLDYAAVLPSEADLWRGCKPLEQLQLAGAFQFVLSNASEAAFTRPVIRNCKPYRIAFFGLFVPPHRWSADEDTPAAEPAMTANLSALRQSMVGVNADLNVVLAAVHDTRTLLSELPPRTVIVPAAGSPAEIDAMPADGNVRIAPPLVGPRQLGRIQVTLTADMTPAIAFSVDALPPTSPQESVEGPVRRWRTAFDKHFRGQYDACARGVLAYARTQTENCAGDTVADVVADATNADVCLLAGDDARALQGGVISAATLARIIDGKVRIRLMWTDGSQVLQWLQPKSGTSRRMADSPAVSGVVVWRDAAGRIVLALHDGRPLGGCKRLRVAVSTRLTVDAASAREQQEEGWPLLDIVKTALLTRPVVAAAAQRRFEVSDDKVPLASALLLAGARQVPDDVRRAEQDWLQALCRQPDEIGALRLQATMQEALPDRFPSYLELARLEERAGRWELAWNALQMGRVAYPDAWTYPLAQSRLLMAHALPNHALASIDTAAELGAPAAEVAELRGEQALMRGDAGSADRWLSLALKNAAPSDRAMFRALTALARLRRGDARGAQAVWQNVPPSTPRRSVSNRGDVSQAGPLDPLP